MSSHPSVTPFFLILSFKVITTLISTLLYPLRLKWKSYLILLTLSKLLMLPLIFSHFDTPSTINLVFFLSNIDNTSCSILPPVSSSDYFLLFISLPMEFVNSPSLFPPHKTWVYHLTDFELANALFCTFD